MPFVHQPETVVALSYNAADEIIVELANCITGRLYGLTTFGPSGSQEEDVFATGPSVTITLTDIARPNGERFGVYAIAYNYSPSPGPYPTEKIHNSLFVADRGTAGASDQAELVWTYNGIDTVTVGLTAESGVTYLVSFDPPVSGTATTGGPYTVGTSHTITVSDAYGVADTHTLVSLSDNATSRLFGAGLIESEGNAGVEIATSFVGSGDFIGATPALPYWLVDHYTHEFVAANPGNDGTITTTGANVRLQTVRPENLRFVLRLGKLGPSEIEYEISNTATNTAGDPAVSADFVGPYRIDFRLRRSDLGDPVMAGMHTQMSGSDGEEPNERVQAAGKDYLHYLQRRVWPYDATKSYVNWPTGFRFKVTAGEVGQIVKDILETVRDVSANYPAAPDAISPHPSYSLGFTVVAASTGHTINYSIEPFDSRTIYDMVQELSQMDELLGGFDFYMSWDKVFHLVAPKLGDPASPIFTLQVDVTSHEANMLEIGFTNTGPDATHVLGVGAGTSTRQGGVNKHFATNSAVFRRHDSIEDYGDVKNLTELEALTSSTLGYVVQPVHEIPITVNPADIPFFWTITSPGLYINVIYDFGWHQVNSIQRIVEMDCSVDLEGNERVTLGLNQYYARSNDGVADW